MSCQDLDQTLLPYLYDELSAGERAAYDAHLASCPDCRSALEESRRLHQVLGQRPTLEPTPEMIVHCRQALRTDSMTASTDANATTCDLLVIGSGAGGLSARTRSRAVNYRGMRSGIHRCSLRRRIPIGVESDADRTSQGA